MTDKIVVFTTCNSEEQAAQVARHLVELRLAGCATILPGARSFYRWPSKDGEGEIKNAPECVVMIKSRRDLFSRLREAIGKVHSDEIPEVIAIPVIDGSDAYLKWLDRELAK